MITDSIKMPDGEFIKLMDEVRAINIQDFYKQMKLWLVK